MFSRKFLALLFFALSTSLALRSQTDEPPASDQVTEPVSDLLSIRPVDRILTPIINDQRVVLTGQRHPLAQPEFLIGKAAPDLRLPHMVLVLAADPVQDAMLAELLRAQQDPGSRYYHHWLTPEQFGKRFGVSQNDVNQVRQWLQGNGLEVEDEPIAHRTLVFSGTVAQVESTFHTSIQKYLTQDTQYESLQPVQHYGNASDPEIPQALAAVVRGVLALHDFHSAPAHVIAPKYTLSNGSHMLMPADWATIYDVAPLYAQSINGTGRSIVVLGRVDVELSDVRTFRSNAGLPANDPQIVINGADPGYPDSDDEMESALDVEWAGAIAANATVKFVTTQSGSSDGIALSAQYAVNNNVAQIVSLSYGQCEAALGSGGNAFWNSTWAQAAAQGVTVLVSSGDSGAAGCDSPSEATATQGRGVNGLCSSPNSTCVGGTEFNDASNPSAYWSTTNGAGESSALSYIPELVWNDSGWSGGLWAGGGGASIVYSKPGWQSAPGVPADGKRDVPDVSMHASIEDPYIVEFQSSVLYVSGTSAAAPSLASVMALVSQHAAGSLGNANPGFYALANQQLSAGGAAVFHDTASGNNSVPGVTGFNAAGGYDEATGLGSVDASLLVNHWGTSTSNFALTPGTASVSVVGGGSGTAAIMLTAQGGFTAPVTVSASGAPSGVTVHFSSSTLTASTPVTATISVTTSAAAGSSTILISGSGGGLTRTETVALTVIAPNFTLTPGVTGATVAAGSPVTVAVSTATITGYSSAIALTASGLPAGVTAAFAPGSIASPGTGTSTMTLTAGTSAAGGISTVTIKGTGSGVSKTQTITLTVVVPTFTPTAVSASATVTAGSATTFVLSTSGANEFKSAIGFTVSGLPGGATATFAPASIAAPGSGSTTLTLTTAATTLGNTYSPIVTATGGGVTKTLTLSLRVIGPTFTLGLSGASVVVARGGLTAVTVTGALFNGFTATIALSVSGLPAGVTATFAPPSLTATGNGSSVLTLKAASTAAVRTSTLTVTASGGGATKTQTLSLAVQ